MAGPGRRGQTLSVEKSGVLNVTMDRPWMRDQTLSVALETIVN
ncbi:hypothetical protein TNCV_2092581, partial [Trichonephila clavipes]